MCRPPVNALDVAGWHDLADVAARARRRAATCASSSSRPRGAGSTPASTSRRCSASRGAHEALLGANRGCFAAFAAVYECAVPVIAAVHGYCLGGGDRPRRATPTSSSPRRTPRFGLPEVDRGALGAATHLARLVPQHQMRAMVYTGARATAGRAARLRVRAPRRASARSCARRRWRWPRQIAAKSPTVIRAAKQSLNGIDPVDVKRSYRYEQGFTFELNLAGVGGRGARGVRRGKSPSPKSGEAGSGAVSDKRMTEDDVVAELRDGMTIGIGGWGSRRKPMSLVRAIVRSPPEGPHRSSPTAARTWASSARPAR